MAAPLERLCLIGIRNQLRASICFQGRLSRVCCRALRPSCTQPPAGVRLLHSSCTRRSDWDLVSAVSLERSPVITQEKNEVEKRFEEVQERYEYEFSHLSEHELRHLEDLNLFERRKQEDYEETEAESVRQTAVESEDVWEAELLDFKPAPRITEADEKNDTRSLQRKLDRKLVLLVKQQLGDQEHWVMPKGRRLEGESMREAAQRVLTSLCGEDLQTTFLGNAPCGFLKYKYSETQENNSIGAKVFFFKALLNQGQVVQTDPSVSDHVWVTKEELPNYVTSKYYNEVKKFILDL